tara:strand:- start:1251 stop:1697 length:447 start_codon:yes stop_codon:yes gene_type:complete
MENSETQYKNEEEESFIQYIFSKSPENKGVIKLECGLPEEGKPFPKHMFEQLLEIFVEGLKYLWGKENKVNIGDLTLENIGLMKQYFESFNVDLQFNMFLEENYIFKPYIYGNPVLEEKYKKINDYFYQVDVNKDNLKWIYRVSFELL